MINNLLDITSSDQTFQMAIIAIGGLGIGIFLVRFAIRRMGENKFRKLTEELDAQIAIAKKELETLFLPTHLVEEKDVEDLKTRHQPLLDAIEELEDHKYYNDDIVEETDIPSFKTLIANSAEKIEENNKVYHAINDLKKVTGKVMNDYQSLVHPSHYFAHS